MTALLVLFLALCTLTSFLIVSRYLTRSRRQEISFDCRLQQHLLEHAPQLPRPFVREWYGGSDVVTHHVGLTRK